MLTKPQIQAATGATSARAELFFNPLNAAMIAADITTPIRIAAFLSQVGHESGNLAFTREIWGPTPQQLKYEGRKDLGNTQLGDGLRYRGRGLIQITGRANYAAARVGMQVYANNVPDFEANPTLLEDPKWAALSAAWFWNSRGLSPLADAGQFEQITRKINGGLNGQTDRLIRFARARVAMGLP